MAILYCTSGCCILGLPIGIWSLVILLSADVQAAFRAAALPQPDQGLR